MEPTICPDCGASVAENLFHKEGCPQFALDVDKFTKDYEAEKATWPESAKEAVEMGYALAADNFAHRLRLLNAIEKHLPALKTMAGQVISPKENTFSKMVKDFEDAIKWRRR